MREDDATDFWQAVMDTGYLMEGENRAYERERMKWLAEGMNSWLKAHPEITEESDKLEHFAMCAVHRLVNAFVFNDGCGADRPDFKERLLDKIVAASGGAEALADQVAEVDDDDLPTH
jgi:hypothetical protein